MQETTVRAAIFTGPAELRLVELPVPQLPAAGATAHVVSCSVCGSDADQFLAHPAGAPPVVPGHEVVARILDIDPIAAERWSVGPGDLVVVEPTVHCGLCVDCLSGRFDRCRARWAYAKAPIGETPEYWGGFAEQIAIAPGSSVYRLPSDIPQPLLSLVGPLSNSCYWVERAGGIVPGSSVLILGCGQRAILTAMLVRMAGASKVVVTGLTRDLHKLRLASRFGATLTVNVEQEGLREACFSAQDTEAFDIVFDATPADAHPLDRALELVASQGRVVVAGAQSKSSAISSALILERNLVVYGAAGRSDGSTRSAIALLRDKRFPFDELITHRWQLDELEAAIRAVAGEVDDCNPVHGAVHFEEW